MASAQPSRSGTETAFDDVLADAIRQMTRVVADQAMLVGTHRIGEMKYMKPALKDALSAAVGASLYPHECREMFKHWQGPAEVRLGGIDIAVRRDDDSGWRAFMELKWGDLDWAILDFFKMTTGRVSPGADACYVVAGEPVKAWAAGNPVGELFQTAEWNSQTVLERCRTPFVGDGREHGKLTHLPPAIATTLVADEPVPEPLHEWHVKAIRVEPRPLREDGWLSVVDGSIR